MKLKVFVVRDVMAEVGQLPLYREKEAIAIRDFEMAVTNAQNPMSENPDDYVLYEIGEYDDEKMELVPMDPKRVITGMEAVRLRREKVAKLDGLQAEIKKLEAVN